MSNANLIANPPLPKVQEWMRWALTGRGREPISCLNVIGETPTLSKQKRLSIYGNGYFLRLIDCLRANFPALANFFGPDLFFETMRAYLLKHPSDSPCIDNVGDKMAEFLKKQPVASDLARVEWAFHESFYGDELSVFDFSQIKKWPQATLAKALVRLDPSVRLLAVKWDVVDLWKADAKWPPAKIAKIKRADTYVITYKNTEKLVRLSRLTRPQFKILSSFKKQIPFGKALTTLKKVSPADTTAWFNEWAQNGVIQSLVKRGAS